MSSYIHTETQELNLFQKEYVMCVFWFLYFLLKNIETDGFLHFEDLLTLAYHF